MQRPRNGDAATPRGNLAEKRVAESNATVNHFLGATRRPWMINTLPSPGVQTGRKPLQWQQVNTTRRTKSKSVSAVHPNRSHTAPCSRVTDLSSSGHNQSNLVVDETAQANIGGNGGGDVVERSDPNVDRAIQAQQRPQPEQNRALHQSIAITPVESPLAQNLAGGLSGRAFADLVPGGIDASSTSACRPNPPQHGDQVQLSSVQQPLSRPQSASTPRANTEHTNSPALAPWSIASGPVSSSQLDAPRLPQPRNWQTLRSSPAHFDFQAAQQPYLRWGSGQSTLPDRPTGLPIPTSVSRYREHAGFYGQDVRAPLPNTTFHMASNSIRLVPAPDYELAQQANPNPRRTALHQAYLEGPAAVTMDTSGRIASDIGLYQYLWGFALQPEIFDHESPLFSFDFDLNAAEMSKLAKQFLSSDYQTCRLVSDGCIIYQLRGIETSHQEGCRISESDWSASKTCWPPSCFVRVNDEDVELRRKVHYGRDLPVDLRPHIRQGKNNIIVAFLRFPTAEKEEPKPTRFAMAVEKIGVGDERRVRSEPTTLTPDASLHSITQHFASVHGDNDEVLAVDSHISIDLIDPFTATIFDTPARGRTCTHRECFDLDTFLQTRKAVGKGGLAGPDEWKCPVCKRDARPQSLVIDGFLKMVRDSLVSSGTAAANDAKAILVGSDGKWKVKKTGEEGFERASTTREGTSDTILEGERASSRMRTASVDINRGERVVIQIDDD